LYREGICIPTLRETPGGVVRIKGERRRRKKKDDLEETHTEIEIEKFVYSFSTI
jgi:hypothetical protein